MDNSQQMYQTVAMAYVALSTLNSKMQDVGDFVDLSAYAIAKFGEEHVGSTH